MSSSTPFTCRWALLGLSSIAVTFVEDLLLARDASDPIRHEVVCVSTTGTVERARKWLADRKVLGAEDDKTVKVYSSSYEMLAGGDFDVVYISTPHPLHYQAALSALRHQRSVLVEKPATMNRAQFLKLADVAKTESQAVLMEAMWTRYLPATLHLQNELLPKIGTVKRVFSDLSVPIVDPAAVSETSARLIDKQAGAGAMLDMGVYALTWADVALGGSDATKVAYADSIPFATGSALIDDINTVVLRRPSSNEATSSAAVAIVTTSLSLAGAPCAADKLTVEKNAPGVRIEATHAQVSVPFPLIRPQELHVEWYGDSDANKTEAKKEVLSLPVARGWGLWYQADVMAKTIQAQRAAVSSAASASATEIVSGKVIGEEDSARILGWMDVARQTAGIAYDAALEAV
ncbi:hypothetical protein SBRCBS47491_005459 [Sporothrix bragantina]|uniref:D-xylose 1-dehydrogenase (NADP(+), D-xylono-1,5-lactone-forming) n=1 Tax=Sporothrix bragantina TaxID=671064 RepID=A0ABP0BYL0_9PEZI